MRSRTSRALPWVAVADPIAALRNLARLRVRREAGMYAYEGAGRRAGVGPVAGVDEAGRGACAGPLVVAAAVLPGGRRVRIPGLADSKLLTEAAREHAFAGVLERAEAHSVVVVPAAEVDRLGLHVCNIAAVRRALAKLHTCSPRRDRKSTRLNSSHV